MPDVEGKMQVAQEPVSDFEEFMQELIERGMMKIHKKTMTVKIKKKLTTALYLLQKNVLKW